MNPHDVQEGGGHGTHNDNNDIKTGYMRGLNPSYFPPLFQLWRGHVALLTTWAQRLDPITTVAVTMTITLSGIFLNNVQLGHEAYSIIVLFLFLLSFMETSRYQSFLAVRRRTDAIQSGFFVPVLANLYDTRSKNENVSDRGHIVLDVTQSPLEDNKEHFNRNPFRNCCLCKRPSTMMAEYETPWERLVSHSLVSPYSPLSWMQAWTIRYKRVYVFLLTGTILVWFLKLYVMAVALPGIWIVSVLAIHLIFTTIICIFGADTVHDV